MLLLTLIRDKEALRNQTLQSLIQCQLILCGMFSCLHIDVEICDPHYFSPTRICELVKRSVLGDSEESVIRVIIKTTIDLLQYIFC